MFRKILIANRGAIACRIMRTLKRMGIGSVAVYSEADANSLHVRAGRRGVLHRSGARRGSYLRAGAHPRSRARVGRAGHSSRLRLPLRERRVRGSLRRRGHRLHRPDARADARLRPQAHGARARAAMPDCRCCPAPDCWPTCRRRSRRRERIGYPVMLKSTAGGGGIGMRLCDRAQELDESFAAVQRLAAGNFSNAGVFLEKFVARARHIEVQLFGDGRGTVIALGERDCSVQRRNQKVIEESPAPGPRRRDARASCTPRRCGSASAVGYRSAGTVEFVYDADARAVLLPRGQHAAAGRARRHRGSGRHRSRRVDDPHRGGRAAGSRGAASRAARPRDPGAGLCRRSGAQLPPVERPADAASTRANTGACASTPGSRPAPKSSAFYDPMLAKIIAHGDDARARHRESRRGAARDAASTASRPICATCCRCSSNPCSLTASRPRRLLATHAHHAPVDRSARARHADHGAGLAGTPGTVGRRRAAVGPDGLRSRFGSRIASSATTKAPRRWK